MDVFEAIEKRRSVRKYELTPVPRERLEKILEAARLAPSASNLQPRHFIVVNDAERRDALSTGMFAGFLKQAPVNEKHVRDVLKIPKNLRVIVMLAVGYPGDKESLASKVLRLVRKRKSLDELMSLEEYGKAYRKAPT